MLFHKKPSFPKEQILFLTLFLFMSILFALSSALQFQKINTLQESIGVLAKETVRLKQNTFQQNIIEKGIQATIGIFGTSLSTNISSQTQSFLGSGAFIQTADGKVSIVSNYHVIAQKMNLKGKSHDGKSFDLEVLLSDKEHDIALLACKSACPNIEALPISASNKRSEAVLGIGFHEEIPHLIFSHIVSTEYSNELQKQLLAFSGLISQGDSGGPLINSYGELIALHQGFSLDQNISFAIPSSQIITK